MTAPEVDTVPRQFAYKTHMPQTPLADLCDWLREDVDAGVWSRGKWDPNGGGYVKKRSNKTVRLWAEVVLNKPCSMDEAWAWFFQVAGRPLPAA